MKEPFSNMKTVNSTTTGNTNQFEASSLNSPKHSGSTETVPYDTLWYLRATVLSCVYPI